MKAAISDALKKQLAESDVQLNIIKKIQNSKADRRKSQQPVEQERRLGDRRGKR